LIERRQRDLDAQIGALADEFVHWKAISELTKPYEKHNSQIRALEQQMLDLARVVKEQWEQARLTGNPYPGMRAAYLNVLALQTVWDYFRSKLLLRSDSWFGPFVKAADAYAWACYDPVRRSRVKATGVNRREPPLTALDAEVSPWALSRDRTYSVQGDRTGRTELELFARVRDKLPVPVLGLPWHNVVRLPFLAVLAHECGHLVEADFGLEERVNTGIRNAVKDEGRREGWLSWRAEVFADLFGCWVAGPSWVWTLIELMPDYPTQVAAQERSHAIGWGKYPTATLRVLLNVTALRTLKFGPDASDIWDQWSRTFPSHKMTTFEDDAKAIPREVFEAVALPKTLKYSSVVQQERFATERAKQYDLDLAQTYDPRALVAAAGRLSRTRPAGLDLPAVWARLQRHIVLSRPPGLLNAQAQGKNRTTAVLKTNELADIIFLKPADVADDT
jgi:hypothetical protein